MPTRRYGLIAAIALALLGAAWFASPWVATSRMRKAAEAGDGERLARYVDYPALRQSLTEQIQWAVVGKPAPDGLRSNPFAAFGAALVGTMTAPLVDSMVTPESVIDMVDRGVLRRPGAEEERARDAGDVSSSKPGIERHRHYESPGVFDVDMDDADTHERLITLVFHRERLFLWKLSGVRLPASSTGSARP